MFPRVAHCTFTLAASVGIVLHATICKNSIPGPDDELKEETFFTSHVSSLVHVETDWNESMVNDQTVINRIAEKLPLPVYITRYDDGKISKVSEK